MREGELVDNGQVIAVMDNSELEAELAKANATADQAREPTPPPQPRSVSAGMLSRLLKRSSHNDAVISSSRVAS